MRMINAVILTGEERNNKIAQTSHEMATSQRRIANTLKLTSLDLVKLEICAA